MRNCSVCRCFTDFEVKESKKVNPAFAGKANASLKGNAVVEAIKVSFRTN